LIEWVQLGGLAYLACLGLGRMAYQASRGVPVFAVDWERTRSEILTDWATALGFLIWGYEVVAHAWPLGIHFVPGSLRIPLFESVVLQGVGAGLWVLGLVVYTMGVLAMGDSWRLGVDRDRTETLVTNGLFAWSRNPIYVSFNLLFGAAFLMQGRLIFLVLALGMAALFHMQILREERFLSRHFGVAFDDYCARVRRYATLRIKGKW
jgi:protein-S-isoprenylcysteine O-methyltransferase Ste14